MDYADIYKKLDSYEDNEDQFQKDLYEYARTIIPNLSIREFGAIYYHAYEDGHSYGYHEILSYFCDLLNMVERLYDLRDDRLRT